MSRAVLCGLFVIALIISMAGCKEKALNLPPRDPNGPSQRIPKDGGDPVNPQGQ